MVALMEVVVILVDVAAVGATPSSLGRAAKSAVRRGILLLAISSATTTTTMGHHRSKLYRQ
jgi:hypothetical protein